MTNERKAVPILWGTGDTCTVCGHDGMVFHYDCTVNGWRREHHGILECPRCDVVVKSFCYDYQVPEVTL